MAAVIIFAVLVTAFAVFAAQVDILPTLPSPVSPAARSLKLPASEIVGEDSLGPVTEHAAPIPKSILDRLDPSLVKMLEDGSCADPIAASAPVGDDYFADAILLGNSRTQGLVLYNALTLPTSYAYRGMSVKSFFGTEYVETASGSVTVPEAMKAAPAFTKAYLMFGTNELGWPNIDNFIKYYGAVIDAVREANPDATVYIQSIIPVSASRSEQDEVFNNLNITVFNIRLRCLAREKDAYYIDVAAGLTGGRYVLDEDASSDGLHLKKDGCVKWYEYLKTHTASVLG